MFHSYYAASKLCQSYLVTRMTSCNLLRTLPVPSVPGASARFAQSLGTMSEKAWITVEHLPSLLRPQIRRKIALISERSVFETQSTNARPPNHKWTNTTNVVATIAAGSRWSGQSPHWQFPTFACRDARYEQLVSLYIFSYNSAVCRTLSVFIYDNSASIWQQKR
jgi:hypothetical protein